MSKCLIVPVFSKEVIDKLKQFTMVQQELSRELLEAPLLGICKITTYVDPELNFKSLDLTWKNGKNSTRTATILTRERLRETL